MNDTELSSEFNAELNAVSAVKPACVRYLTKSGLYGIVTRLIKESGFSFDAVNYCVNSIELAQKVCTNLKIEYLDFKSTDLCGILYKTEKSTSIALNSRRSSGGRNFDCMHELIHYWMHDSSAFYCNGGTNDYLEWQANEGAAQFLMPYQVFIPAYTRLSNILNHSHTTTEKNTELISRLSRKFNVGNGSVEIRIKSLAYEISQYNNGVPIEKIKILSRKNQEECGFARSLIDYHVNRYNIL